jgi:aminopeptidase N
LSSGAAFTTTVAYHGKPQPIMDDPGTRYPVMLGWIKWQPGIFVTSQPSGAMTWYPVNDHPGDKATYAFTITATKPYVVAANGLLLDVRDNGATRTYVWAENQPMASYLATLAIAPFAVITDVGPQGLPIRHYVPPGASSALIRELRNTPAMIQFLHDLVGPYPFEAYGVAVIDMYSRWGLETQTLTILDLSLATREDILLHELAHHWFGNYVTPATWQDAWLNEGFATYIDWLWIEHRRGAAYLNKVVSAQYTTMKLEKMWAPAQPHAGYLFDEPIYKRGGWTLHALRLRIGDERFFRLLRTWVERHQYGNASTADFMALAEEVSGQDLDDFFQVWLYNDEIPPMPELTAPD